MSAKIEKVKEYPDFVRMNGAGIINTNHSKYQAALARRKMGQRINQLEDDVKAMNDKLDTILDAITRKE